MTFLSLNHSVTFVMHSWSVLLALELFLLWPPCVADADIIFLSCGFFYLLSLSFFPCLISAVADWMSAILAHMVWLLCEFRMQVWNELHAARWKYRTQNIAPLHNFVGPYLRNYSMHRQSEKNLLNSNTSSTCPYNMVNLPLAAEIGPVVRSTPANIH